MAYHQKLATSILKAANNCFPAGIENFADLQRKTRLTGKPWDDEWRLALEGLLQEGLIAIDHPLRTGVNRVLLDFIGLRVTEAGRQAA